MHTFSLPLLLSLLSLEKAKAEPRKWQIKEPHLIPDEATGQAMLEVISRHVKDKQIFMSPFRLHRQQQHLVCLKQHLPTAAASPWIQKEVYKGKKPLNQHKTSFLLFKAGLSTKNHAEEIVFSSKHNLKKYSTSNKTGTSLLSIHRNCLEQEPGLLLNRTLWLVNAKRAAAWVTTLLIASICTLSRSNTQTKEQDKLSGILKVWLKFIFLVRLGKAKVHFPNKITGSSTEVEVFSQSTVKCIMSSTSKLSCTICSGGFLHTFLYWRDGWRKELLRTAFFFCPTSHFPVLPLLPVNTWQRSIFKKCS